ncbi:MAG: STAS domain-containing protein [Planctomycetes bacterium]|nr:STAS domain-containing protein [Planctomycetota bacterium]
MSAPRRALSIEHANLFGGIDYLICEGSIDTRQAAEKLDTVMRSLQELMRFRYILDLSGVKNIASTGLAIIISTQNLLSDWGGNLVVMGANKTVMSRFEMLGVTGIIPFAPSMAEALKMFPKQEGKGVNIFAASSLDLGKGAKNDDTNDLLSVDTDLPASSNFYHSSLESAPEEKLAKDSQIITGLKIPAVSTDDYVQTRILTPHEISQTTAAKKAADSDLLEGEDDERIPDTGTQSKGPAIVVSGTVTAECPGCEASGEVPSSFRGKTLVCSNCQTRFKVE